MFSEVPLVPIVSWTRGTFMKNKLKLGIFLALTSSNILGCAAGALRVNSSPEKAEVFVTYEGEQPNKIGETPLNLDSRVIDENRGKYLTVSIKKEGYQTESVIVPNTVMSSTFDMSSRLEEYKLPLQCQDQTASIEKISRGVAQAQSMMQTSRLVEAQGQLSMLITDFPNVSVLHDLMGNVHYMNKNLEMAYASYRKSLELNPANVDTQRMVTKIQGIIGIRVPASSGGR